jgi:hypothetical protein
MNDSEGIGRFFEGFLNERGGGDSIASGLNEVKL